MAQDIPETARSQWAILRVSPKLLGTSFKAVK